METFTVMVHKGTVRNVRNGTTRQGCWIPLKGFASLPPGIASRFGADKATARESLAWDVHKREWRDMKGAKVEGTICANATIVQMGDGKVGIALLDF